MSRIPKQFLAVSFGKIQQITTKRCTISSLNFLIRFFINELVPNISYSDKQAVEAGVNAIRLLESSILIWVYTLTVKLFKKIIFSAYCMAVPQRLAIPSHC